jgi:hypothetical protein
LRIWAAAAEPAPRRPGRRCIGASLGVMQVMQTDDREADSS